MKKDSIDIQRELSKPIPKRIQKNIELQFLPIAEHKDSKIYMAQTDIPDWKTNYGSIQICNSFFRKIFVPDKSKLEIDQRLHIICWAAEGMVVSEYQSHVSEDTAKEVALALHLGIPVWTLRDINLQSVYCVMKSMQGGKYNPHKFAQIITEKEMEQNSITPQSGQEVLIKSKME